MDPDCNLFTWGVFSSFRVRHGFLYPVACALRVQWCDSWLLFRRPYFEHQSWANNVQRLPRIHSHIRGLCWTSKRFLLASTCRPPLITQLPVCSCHLSECVYVWVYIIVIQYQLRHSNVVMSKKRKALMLRHKVALINEAESGKSCRQLAGRTQATSIIKRKAELLLEYDQNIYMQHWFFSNK